MVLINGREAGNREIDASKHKFIGMFRSPLQLGETAGYVMCGCGQVLQNQEQLRIHWQNGHFDVAQYVTIEDNEIR